jgi:hypothetical protein
VKVLSADCSARYRRGRGQLAQPRLDADRVRFGDALAVVLDVFEEPRDVTAGNDVGQRFIDFDGKQSRVSDVDTNALESRESPFSIKLGEAKV